MQLSLVNAKFRQEKVSKKFRKYHQVYYLCPNFCTMRQKNIRLLCFLA